MRNLGKSILSLAVAMTFMSSCAMAQIQSIKLEKANMERGTNVMKALQARESIREFSDKMLSKADLSDLLWAAYGVNRADGKRTAASCLNKMDVDLYVLTAEGTYLYMPDEHMLKPVAEGDHRALIRGGQTDFPLAPVNLVIVSITSRLGFDDKIGAELAGAIDGALVSQNIALFCAANGLATVPRGSMDKEGLKKLLSLPDDAYIVINNPVGYKK